MPGSLKGILVGFANTLVVAACIAMISRGGSLELFTLIVVFGFLPGVITGALLGHFAAESKANRRVVLVGMIAVAGVAVSMLGAFFGVGELVLVSCIPTAAACSILERWTRPEPEASLPIARVA